MAKAQIPINWFDTRAVETWLHTQPRDLCVALAARTALRSLPVIEQELNSSRSALRRTTLLPTFRAAASSWLSAVGPNQSAADQVIAAAQDASAGFRRAANVRPVRSARAAAHAAAARAEDIASAAAAAFDVDATAARNAAAAAADAALGNARTLSQAPLWLVAMPPWADELWSRLRDHLLAADEGWDVWTTWYEARLRGDPVDVALETRRVIEPTQWDDGPAAVNAEIAAIIADHRASLANRLVQDRRGAFFVEREGRLAIAPGVSDIDPRAAAMQPRTVEVLRRLAEATRNSNQFGGLADTAARLADLAALPPESAAARSFEFWSLSGELAQWRTRDDAAAARGDGFVEALPPNLRQALDAAVPATALYARSFSEVRAYDDELADYEGRVASTATQRAILDAALSADAIDKDDAATISVVIVRGSEHGPHASRAEKAGGFTTRNMAVAAGCFIATAFAAGYVGEVGAGLAQSHGAAARFERFLDQAGSALDDVMRDAPDDLRQAVDAVRTSIREKP